MGQLKIALDQMTLAKKAGFTASLAVFETFDRNNGTSVSDAAFSDVWCRAHETNPSQDWGRNIENPAYIDCHVENGRLVQNVRHLPETRKT